MTTTAFDITATAVQDVAALHLKDAKGNHLFHNGQPVRIHLYGPGSDAFAMIEARQTQRVLKRREDNDGKPALPSPEERRIEEAEDLAAITAKFENLGYPPAGDAQGAALYRALFADPKLGFIAVQARKFVADWGNFSSGSATA